jgi:hypothetical protein
MSKHKLSNDMTNCCHTNPGNKYYITHCKENGQNHRSYILEQNITMVLCAQFNVFYAKTQEPL